MGKWPPTVTLRVKPRSGSTGVGPWRDQVLQVRVTPPPTDGEATAAALVALAAALDVPRSAVRLLKGDRSRLKRVVVAGLTAEQLAVRLERLGDAAD